MSEIRLTVLYPRPADVERFERDYEEHRLLLHRKMGIPEDARPYTMTRFLPTPEGPAPFHRSFSMPFPSTSALRQAMDSPEMQEVAADAARISTGGPPVVLVGEVLA